MNQLEFTARTLPEIRGAVNRLAKKINAPANYLPTFGTSEDFGRPHIEVSADTLHFVVIERGCELERRTTRDPELLMYWIFAGITHMMGFDFELKNRKETEDCRRMGFAKQLELLGNLNHIWEVRRKSEIEGILAEHPYDDFASIRAQRCKQYRDSGYSDAEAWKLTCEDYPTKS